MPVSLIAKTLSEARPSKPTARGGRKRDGMRYARSMFALDRVTRGFAGVPLFDSLDLTIEAGRTTVLIGPSGCGKSTLVRLLLGLLWPESGEVRFDGQALMRATVRALRRRMGYVIQGGGLFPHLTARGNAALMARHLGWERTRIDDRVTELTALTRFPADALDRYPAQLSGGQRQRVALMRGLMLDPDVLLLDEPFAALDPMVRHRLQSELREVFRTLGRTVVMVTHDLGEAAFLGDDIVLLDAGRVVQRGSAHDLVERPAGAFGEAFVSAQRTLLDSLAEDR
jgi:osmoprotectant transport system ATP-binding protein